MALLDATLNIGATAMQDSITHVSIHTALPNGSGSNESTAARQPITWATAANGDMVMTGGPIDFTGGAASGPATHVGYWSAVTVGTFRGFQPLTGDQTFNAAGEYSINALTENGSAS